MEIGKKLKEARIKTKMTQEQVADALFVSRQTISNWENERSFPDIVSVVKLSDLFSVSLDELLKGDNEMLEHLEESTNVVRSNRRLIGAAIIDVVLFLSMLFLAYFTEGSVYMIVCAFCLMVIGIAFLLYQIVKRI